MTSQAKRIEARFRQRQRERQEKREHKYEEDAGRTGQYPCHPDAERR
jgi:hypothetical protein